MEPEKEISGGITSLIPKASFAQVVNHPLTWAFIIITIMGGGSFWLYTQAHKETVKNLELQIHNCEQENQVEKENGIRQQKRADDLYQQVLIDRGYKADTTKKQ